MRFRSGFGHPALKLVSDVAQGGPCHRKDLSIRTEEADDPLRLLRLGDRVVALFARAGGRVDASRPETYVRAERGSLPPRASDMLAVRMGN
jgi:hypothetical protein